MFEIDDKNVFFIVKFDIVDNVIDILKKIIANTTNTIFIFVLFANFVFFSRKHLIIDIFEIIEHERIRIFTFNIFDVILNL